jgi:ferredoxin-NADP reductase
MLDTIRTLPGVKPEVLLSFGCRSETSLFCEELLELREAWMSNLNTRISLSQPSEKWSGIIGNPLSAISPDDISEDCVAYVCGSSRLVTFAIEELIAKGLDETRIFSEKFMAD